MHPTESCCCAEVVVRFGSKKPQLNAEFGCQTYNTDGDCWLGLRNKNGPWIVCSSTSSRQPFGDRGVTVTVGNQLCVAIGAFGD